MSDTSGFRPPKPAMPVTTRTPIAPEAAPVPSAPVPSAPVPSAPQPDPIDQPFTEPAPAKPMTQRAAAAARKHNAPRKCKAKKPAPQLSASEITKLNRKRARNMAKKRKPHGPRKALAARPAKNPNRPLEMKNRLETVLSMTTELRKPELRAFVSMMQQLDKLHRGSRNKVLGALNRVFA